MSVDLPIDPHVENIVQTLRDAGSAVLIAPPGSGKTTRIPPALVRAFAPTGQQVVMLEPRRIAARASARRIAQECNWTLGHEVGYHVRFDRMASAATRLLIVTEGILTRRLQSNPQLDGVTVVVLDEFHERSIHTDLALALLREVRQVLAPQLKLVVMSATVEPGPVATFLGSAPIIEVEGRPHPVDVRYLAQTAGEPLVERVVGGVLKALEDDAEGDMLVFLPGIGEIIRCGEHLRARLDDATFAILPLHGDLPHDQQDRALEPLPDGMRKIVLATNVAETSLTIDGVRTVVDSGYVRQMRHDPSAGLDRLELRRTSRASAEQRAGRAGRTAPGRAWRLWTSAEHRGLDPFDVPEIQRVDLAATLLELRSWGETNPRAFSWFEAPAEVDIQRGETLLRQLGAVGPRGRLTALGATLQKLPLHPRLGRLLIESALRGYAADGAVLAALLSERDILLASRAGASGRAAPATTREDSDLLLRLNRFRAAESSGFRASAVRDLGLDGRALQQVRRVARQLERASGRQRPPQPGQVDDVDTALLKSVMAAFPDRVCKPRDSAGISGQLVGGRGVEWAADSTVHGPVWRVALRVDGGGGHRANERVRWASRIEPEWLEDLFPESMRHEHCVLFDEAGRRVVATQRLWYHDLLIEDRPGGSLDPQQATAVLQEGVRRFGMELLPRDNAFRDTIARLACLAEWCPELKLPSLDHAALLEMLVDCCAGKRSFADLRRVDLLSVVKGHLRSDQLAALEREAPERLELPRGRRARIRYEPGKPPTLSARVQDLFGVKETPRLGRGRVACVIELLAPNQRPIQVTQDLASFWINTYPQVRKDLRGRYPKHDWPERPPS